MTVIEKIEPDGIPTLPTIAAVLLSTPLYQKIEIDPERDAAYMERLQFGDLQYDAHCLECGKQSIFKSYKADAAPSVISSNQPWSRSAIIKKRVANLVFEGKLFAIHATCQRYDHLQSFIFSLDKEGGYQEKPLRIFLTKIGQAPSFEDLSGPEGEKFKPLLGEYFAEFKKAGGLFSHGLAIGAFVYLRRVFEGLIEQHRVAFEASNGEIVGYKDMDMKARISALRSNLPVRLVENASVWGIMSKGIHELSEKECAKYFPVVRAAVVAMLEENYERREKAKADAELRKQLAKITSDLAS